MVNNLKFNVIQLYQKMDQCRYYSRIQAYTEMKEGFLKKKMYVSKQQCSLLYTLKCFSIEEYKTEIDHKYPRIVFSLYIGCAYA